jgi:pimeloyl-ACP methyl ester carboxylesterase
MTVRSTDGVELAVHDLGGEGPVLLVSHATGFHGRCYLPLATHLATRFHSVSFDYRGHGDTPAPEQPVDWERYGDDAVAMAASLGGPVVAFGHSMGGACLLMAAHRQPDLFRRLVLFEPIVFPTDGPRHEGGNPLAAGARRRRATFGSFDEAIANYASKPPLGWFTPEALDAYVRFGFAEGDDGQIHLKCRPETEAATFEMGGAHHTWDVLPSIGTPTLVVAGAVSALQPSAVAGGVAERLANADYLELPQFDHFAPMTHPREIADLIADFCTDT